jgi:SAM-dependent methyltransferase
MKGHADRRASPRFWDTDWHVLRRQAAAIAAVLASPALALRGASVLDFGCGSRPYEPWFAAAGASYRGADIDGRHEIAIAADGKLAAPDASVDVVASFQVLEHIWDLDTYLGESNRVLKPGGALLLSTHGSWFYHPHPGDYRRWTADGLRREVEARGFRLVEMRAVVGPLAWTSILRSFGVALAARRIPLAGRALTAMAAMLYNARAWLEDKITPAEVTANNACVYVGLFRKTQAPAP